MKFENFTKLIDFLQKIEIYTSDQDEDVKEPAWSGIVFDCPFIFDDMEIGRINNDYDEPIFTYIKDNESIMVINLINKGDNLNEK